MKEINGIHLTDERKEFNELSRNGEFQLLLYDEDNSYFWFLLELGRSKYWINWLLIIYILYLRRNKKLV